jgi:DNA-binding transcriptional MocR family regulator
MEELFPAGKLSWTRPVGGYTLWVKVSGSSVTEEELMMQLADSGVLVSPGSAYLSPDNAGMSSGTTANASTDGIYFRLSIACTDEEDIRVGIQRVAEAVMSKLDR